MSITPTKVIIITIALAIIGIAAGFKIQIELDRSNPRVDHVVLDKPTQAPVTLESTVPIVEPSVIRVSAIVAPVITVPKVTSPAIVEISSTTITAKAYIVGDLVTGQIYKQLNVKEALPIASISKLITAIVLTKELASSSVITISEPNLDQPVESSGIYGGEQYSVQDILYPLLLSSSNLAAQSIASSSAMQNFIQLMFGYAREIGMNSTRFLDSSGLDSGNVASAQDIFTLAKYIYNHRPDLLTITRNRDISFATTTEHGSHTFFSTNAYVYNSDFIGGKTGRSNAAGETMLTMLNIHDKKVAIIVLGSEPGRREQDTRKLIDSL